MEKVPPPRQVPGRTAWSLCASPRIAPPLLLGPQLWGQIPPCDFGPLRSACVESVICDVLAGWKTPAALRSLVIASVVPGHRASSVLFGRSRSFGTDPWRGVSMRLVMWTLLSGGTFEL